MVSEAVKKAVNTRGQLLKSLHVSRRACRTGSIGTHFGPATYFEISSREEFGLSRGAPLLAKSLLLAGISSP